MEDCIFCKIIKKEIPSTIVYEDDEVLAFEDVKPMAPVHTLIVPKKHIACLAEMQVQDMKIIAKIYEVANQIAEEKGIKQKGYRVVVNCGEDGGQEVKHLHFHLLGGRKLATNV